MGLLDSILSPIKDVIKNLDPPLNLVMKVFGEVIKFTEEIINMIEGMIRDIEDMFNASKVESIFLYPFKEAALVAVGSVEKIFELLKDLIPSPNGYKEFILSPLEDAYSIAKKSTKALYDEGLKIIDYIEKKIYSNFSIVKNHFETVGATLDTFPSELLSIGEKIKRNFEIEVEKLFHIVPEFAGYVKNEADELSHRVENRITTSVESFKGVEDNLKARFLSEHYAIDFFLIIIFVLFLALLGGVYYVTRSMVAIGAILMILIIALFFYVISKFMSALFL